MTPRRRVSDPLEATTVSDGRKVLGSFSGRAPNVEAHDLNGDLRHFSYAARGDARRCLAGAEVAEMSDDFRMILPMAGAKTGNAFTTRDFNERVSSKVDAALAKDGIESLYAPRWHACVHEAGHYVSYTLDGFGVASVRVRSRWFNDKETWGGQTTPRLKIPDSGEASTIAEDLLALRQHSAGILCEICFLPDVRAGSSVDEIAIGQMLAENVGTKTGRHPHDAEGAARRHQSRTPDLSKSSTARPKITRPTARVESGPNAICLLRWISYLAGERNYSSTFEETLRRPLRVLKYF
jgi:hypothetical protein